MSEIKYVCSECGEWFDPDECKSGKCPLCKEKTLTKMCADCEKKAGSCECD